MQGSLGVPILKFSKTCKDHGHSVNWWHNMITKFWGVLCYFYNIFKHSSICSGFNFNKTLWKTVSYLELKPAVKKGLFLCENIGSYQLKYLILEVVLDLCLKPWGKKKQFLNSVHLCPVPCTSYNHVSTCLTKAP